MLNIILSKVKEREDKLIALRRKLHKVPEIGGKLPQTRKIVCDYLDEIGVSYTLNPHDDGVVAEINGKQKGKIIAFRADMDGLHVDEQSDYSFKSVIDGQMHGCGHDAHTAMLLVAAEILNEQRETLKGTVRFIFQSGEETGTGAKEMLKLGAINDVDAICALHVGNLAGDEHKWGDIIVLPGPVSAGKNKFSITVLGKGGHSAFPHKAIDPIIVGAKIVERCHEMMENEYKDVAAVLTFGTFNAGVDHNTIPETAVLKGSIRVQDKNLREQLTAKLEDIAFNTAKEFGADCKIEIIRGSETVVNNPDFAKFVARACENVLGKEKVKTEISGMLMGSDDFANYSSLVPAVYFFLHTNNNEKNIIASNHNPKFDIDESVLWEGVAAYVSIAQKFLQ